MHVHDSENEYPLGSHLIENAIGKAAGARPPGPGRECGPGVGKGDDPLHGAHDFSREFETEAFPLAVVVRNRLLKLGLCGLKEADVHQLPVF